MPARVEPEALVAPAKGSSIPTHREAAPEDAESEAPPPKTGSHFQKYGFPCWAAGFPSDGESLQLSEEVLQAIRRGTCQASPKDAVDTTSWFPEWVAWAETLEMERAWTDPVEAFYHDIRFFLADLEGHWYTLHFEPARVFAATICVDCLGALSFCLLYTSPSPRD